eukprot:1923827-Amphidinium_carterae.2
MPRRLCRGCHRCVARGHSSRLWVKGALSSNACGGVHTWHGLAQGRGLALILGLDQVCLAYRDYTAPLTSSELPLWRVGEPHACRRSQAFSASGGVILQALWEVRPSYRQLLPP